MVSGGRAETNPAQKGFLGLAIRGVHSLGLIFYPFPSSCLSESGRDSIWMWLEREIGTAEYVTHKLEWGRFPFYQGWWRIKVTEDNPWIPYTTNDHGKTNNSHWLLRKAESHVEQTTPKYRYTEKIQAESIGRGHWETPSSHTASTIAHDRIRDQSWWYSRGNHSNNQIQLSSSYDTAP